MWLDGEEVTSPTDDPGAHFGEGVFTTVRVERAAPVWLEDHLARLKRQATTLNLPELTITPQVVWSFVAKHRGPGRLKIARTTHHQWMTVRSYCAPTSPLRIALYPYLVEAPHPQLKTLAYEHRHAVKRWAASQGFDDALTTTAEGYLLGGAFSNLFWIHGEVLSTPCKSLPLMEGVCLQRVLRTTELKIQWVRCRLDQVPLDAALFLCNSLQGPCKASLTIRRAHEFEEAKPCSQTY